jgi:predicted nucleic acid-binding protein
MPEEALAGLRRSPKQFARDMRLAAAIFWYAKGEVSQEKAAQIAGLDRTDFLLALSRENVEIFQVDAEDLRGEGAAVLIRDDLAARRCAVGPGLSVRGTLSLVTGAKEAGLIGAAGAVVADVRRAGLYVSDRLVRQVLASVGEASP